MLILVFWWHKLVGQKFDLLLIFLIKCIFSETDLTVNSCIVQILAVEFLCYEHIKELSVFIFGRFNFNLVRAV